MIPRFPAFAVSDGGYESFYLRAVDPERPRGVWLRHTVHKVPNEITVGSVWVTIFDASRPDAVAHKLSVPDPATGDGAWLCIGDSAIGPGFVRGEAGPAKYDLSWTSDEAPLRHLPKEWMYTRALPRTKSESPLPLSTLSGTVSIGDASLDLDGWHGMLGHNWGSQHAERWIWLHGVDFEGAPGAWLDMTVGRVKIGRVTTPWIANGAISVDGKRTRIGGPGAIRSTKVDEDPRRLRLQLPGLKLTVTSPQVVVWRYADPDHSEHNTANCSIAEIEADFGGRRLHSAHGGVYELGMRETDHGLPVQPFTDP